MSQTIKGLLLIAHGSRNPEANEDLVLLGRQMEGGEFPVVEPSYLELAQPSIEDGKKMHLKGRNRYHHGALFPIRRCACENRFAGGPRKPW